MILRRLLLLTLLTLSPSLLMAQSTLVSGTVTDTGGQAWINGTYTFKSQALGQSPISGNLDSAGSYSVSIPHTPATSIVGDVWQLNVCPAFTSGCFNSNPITIVQQTQTLNVTPKAITISVPSTPQQVTPVQAYSDTEITGGWPGFAYWNVTTSSSRQCVTVSGGVCTWAQVSNSSGAATFSNINKVIHVDGVTYTTPESAIAAAPASPQGYQIYHDRIPTTSAGFTMGNSTCPNFLGANMTLDPGASITLGTLNGRINLLCNSKLQGSDLLSSLVTAGAAFTAGPMIEMGDNTIQGNQSLANIRVVGTNLTSGPCIRGRGMTDWASLDHVFVQNCFDTAALFDGTNFGTGFFDVHNSIFGVTSGASATDVTRFNNTSGNVLFSRVTTNCVPTQAPNAAGIHITGATGGSGNPFVSISQHTEKCNDGFLIDNNQSAVIIGGDVGNTTLNNLRIGAGATGSVAAIMLHNNANNVANPVIINQATTTSIGSNNGGPNPTPLGLAPFYFWIANAATPANDSEGWMDGNGFHFNNGTNFSGNSTAGPLNGDLVRFSDTATPRTVALGYDQAFGGTFGLRYITGTGSPHQLVNFSLNGSTAMILPEGSGNNFASATAIWADSGDHLFHYNPNNTGNQQVPSIITLTSQYTNSTTTFSNVAGGNTIQWAVKANTNYTATCHLYYQAAATGGLNIEFTGPASPTNVIYGLDDPSGATTFNSSVATAYSTSLGQAITTAATNFDASVSFSLINGANAGTVNMLAKSSAAAQLQIQAGSYCQIQ